MSEATYSDTPKTGYSSFCRRDSHSTCSMAKARCTCGCHGRRGQEPPTQKEPTMPEASVTPITQPETQATTLGLVCPDCERTFEHPQGLGRHRSAVHGAGAKTKKAPAKAAKTVPERQVAKALEVGERQALAAFAATYAEVCGADVEAAIDGAAAFLDMIAERRWKLIER